ncbi:MAG: chemotaxis-specific protein-glutamate methyltransferase CheB [Methylococcaceae bacterium]|nr:chemotaxis-specific protein-glutamate methyltransferase CheB [Methylococcaceae bacterium]
MRDKPIRVLVVEDSPVERELLLHILQSDPELTVVAVACDGEMAVDMACRERPDVITMDIHLPKLDGLGATRSIMERCPTPVVVVSASAGYSLHGDKAFRALEAGALTLVCKPPGIGHPDYQQSARELIQTVKLMSEVKVVGRRSRRAGASEIAPALNTCNKAKLVAIGASAGGPLAIQQLLAGLPKDFPLPLLIVQHMAFGFMEGFAKWLSESTGFPVHIAAQGEQPLPGHIYVAPCDFQMGVTASGVIALSNEAPEAGLRPAVSYLFRSIAKIHGGRAIAVLLTGMGKDGAVELKMMKDKGAVTIAQDEESCLVYGMPGEAVRLGGASHVLPLEQIPSMLIRLAGTVHWPVQ